MCSAASTFVLSLATMKTLPEGSDVTSLEKTVKNRWKWDWLEEWDSDGVKFSDWCRKVDIPGGCVCVPCGKTLLYGNRGKRSLLAHAGDQAHKNKVTCLMKTRMLDGAETTTCTKPPVGDEVAEVKSVLCMFMAEHCLSYTLSQPLVDLAKRLSGHQKALSSLTFGRACASYTTTHGVASCLLTDLSEKLRRPGTFFSLNVDEATDANNNKILNVLVQYFDEDLGKVTIDQTVDAC